ncbi:MAG: sigma-70 family RNA polymerase sigma factor [Phycisphaerae bacterium]|nr:sigma-70 family RNA polymerase sigma factor [Phycisphaerae bacterium]
MGKVDGAQVPSDRELVLLARKGDLAAFDELVRRYQRRATAVAYRLLSNRDDAMEVAQEAFLRAYDRLKTLDDPAKFGSWLLRTLSNLALNRRRARALRRAASLDVAMEDETAFGENRPDGRTPTPLQQAAGRDMRLFLRDAIDRLPDEQRQALILFSIEKMPQKQVAEILQCSVETVKWNVFLARKRLKIVLRNLM